MYKFINYVGVNLASHSVGWGGVGWGGGHKLRVFENMTLRHEVTVLWAVV
jgi:hypothetical protein